ncbi:GNAT family N-acetyltransferase [Streptomyces sp. NPDC096012]|uniref:GNAT family N-acetyltransferase n=1 Tax=Streptomyces sp. NPDC096012 TaxID=3155684 RepID=UPI00336A4D47
MISSHGAPAVVPAGRLADGDQPVLPLPGGLELRPWHLSDADADALHTAGRDPAISKWNLFRVDSRDQARTRIERLHERRRTETGAIWAIAPLGDAAVGLAGLNDVDLARGTAEVVYWVLPEARGGGVAVQAARRLSDWALADLGLHRLSLYHAVANPASCRVAEKAGYTFEGTLRSAELHTDGWHDLHLHALVAGDV